MINKKGTNKFNKRKFTALLLALTAGITVMSGCSDEASAPETTKNETIGGSNISSSDYDDLVQSIKMLSDEVSELRNMISLAPGILTGEEKEISAEDGKEIERLIAEDEKNFLASPPTNVTSVAYRDWSRYTSLTAKDKLTYAEAACYDRLDEVCRTFLVDPSHGIVEWKDNFTLKGVKYSDLGLTVNDIFNIFLWFKYNNPQYYFIDCFVYIENDSLFITVYDFAAELSDIGATTNTMFDKLDSWIDGCCDDEVTTWQKVCSINKRICEAVIYDPIVSNIENKYTKEESDKASGGKNQTIYSVLMTPETVCAGYARTFNAMANAVGVDSLVTLSDTHAWNAVKFDDNNYYFVDVCWNDTDNGYKTDWIGVGNKYVSLNDGSSCHTYQADYTARWAPELPGSSYQPTENDIGAAKVTLDKPELKITGSGTAGIKVEWNNVEKAEQYYLAAKDENDYIVQKYTEDTFMYIPYTSSSNSLTVYVCAQCEDNGITVSSDWGSITCSDKGTGTKPGTPSNVTASLNDKNGLVLKWDTETKQSVLFGYGTDSTLSQMSFSYFVDNAIGWQSWNPDEETYFCLASVTNDGGRETLSDPVAFSYSKGGGLTMITSAQNNIPAAPDNFTINISYSSNGNRFVTCSWDTVNGADGYEFNLSSASDFSHIAGSLICKPGETAVSYLVSDKSEHLYFRVRTVKGSGGSAVYSKWTTADIVTPDAATETPEKPAAPSNIQMYAKGNNIIFNWDEVQGATGYILTLYRDEKFNDVWATYNSTMAEHTIGPFTSGRTYYFSAQAVVSKNGKDAYSDHTYFKFTFLAQPDIPTNIKSVQSGNNLTFTWDKVQNATGYTFTFFKDEYYKDVLISQDIDDPQITASIQGGNTYYCGVQAVNSQNGNKVYSNYACIKVTAEILDEKPDMPTNIKTVQSGNKVTIKWDAVQGVTGYKVTFFKDDKYKDILATYDSNSPEYTVTLTAGSTYYCGICSVVSNNGRDIYSNYAAFPLSI